MSHLRPRHRYVFSYLCLSTQKVGTPLKSFNTFRLALSPYDSQTNFSCFPHIEIKQFKRGCLPVRCGLSRVFRCDCPSRCSGWLLYSRGRSRHQPPLLRDTWRDARPPWPHPQLTRTYPGLASPHPPADLPLTGPPPQAVRRLPRCSVTATPQPTPLAGRAIKITWGSSRR